MAAKIPSFLRPSVLRPNGTFAVGAVACRTVPARRIPGGFQRNSYATAAPELKRTSLHDLHVELGATMVGFAGWSMPLMYKDMSHLTSHLHTRSLASIFDVSHMLQTAWTGKDRVRFIEHLTVADVTNLPTGRGSLSLFTNANGGIIDDTIISKQEDRLYVVSNAGCADKDLAHIRALLKEWQDKGMDVDVNVIDDHSLIALQGPRAATALSTIVGKDLNDFAFMDGRHMSLKGIDCHVARSGYTGEDGFEISVPTNDAVELTRILLENPDVKMAGLAARDSLRLEAGMCLYGHDLSDDITPVEAGLTWTIAKRRREEGGFIGAEKILPQIKGAVQKRRVGLIVTGAPARENAEIYDSSGEQKIGVVTSGTHSPSLKANVAMGYVESGHHKKGTPLKIKVRNKLQDAKVTSMPFVPSSYHKV